MKAFFQLFGMVLSDSVIDTLKLLPILLIVYFLIEFLEYKNVFKFEKSKLLSGKASPALGACIGCIPQCGFSVISSELYAQRKISMGAIIAVFIATSDEAFPLMIASYHAIPSLLMLIAVKLIFAIAIGYLTYFLQKLVFKNSITKVKTKSLETNKVEIIKTEHEPSEKHIHEEHAHEHDDNHHEEDDNQDENKKSHKHIHACCHHDIENKKFNWSHPLVHCAKITLYILIVNVVMGMVIGAIGGETKLTEILKTSSAFQPIFAVLVGIIPNCVSSVVLTELYIMGGLSFGSVVAGLCVNAGIGLLVLFKENKRVKENIFIVSVMVISSLILGYALHFIPFDFLLV